MNRSLVDHIANTLMYEGYNLYPYRPSLKNHKRWTFGGLFPEAYCQCASGDAASLQAECLIQGDAWTTFEAVVRFLHLSDRITGEIDSPLVAWPSAAEPEYRTVPSLQVGAQRLHTWQEGEEREASLGRPPLKKLLRHCRSVRFAFPGIRRLEPVRDEDRRIVAVRVHERKAIAGRIEARALAVGEGLFRVTLRVINCTALDDPVAIDRDAALLRSLASTHVLLGVQHGAFVSLLDPPDRWREEAAACRNVGVWPVLVGPEGQTDTMLASPIILYDYPQVAPESPGDFFDGTEIDEMLTLRIQTMTDEEKRDMASMDERTRGLLERTESLARQQMLGLHGTIRRPKEEVDGELGS
jgi:hydrogenase maturation protease